jgi:hypothetical protein
MLIKLPYGINDGKLLSIREVESGLACNCTCPSCHALLVAKKGRVKTHHFAHYNSEECSGAVETALHLAAKEILKKAGGLMLPALELDFYEVFDESLFTSDYQKNYEHPDLKGLYRSFIEILDAQMLSYDKVESEILLEGIRPDIIVYSKGKPLLVEIGVTHFVDVVKLEKIEQLGISAIEIDLSYLQDGFTDKELEEAVLSKAYNRDWIYNKKQKYLIDKFLDARRKTVAQLHLKKTDVQIEEQRLKDQREKEKRDFINSGHRIIKYNFKTFGFMCPKSIHLNAGNYKSNSITDELKSGAFWNGTIYGNPHTGFNIYLDGKKVDVVAPNNILQDLPAHNVMDMRNQLGQLKSLIHVARKSENSCQSCPHFKTFLNEEIDEVVCSYKANK